MATRKELQEWLNRFPEDTIIRVGIQERATNYESYGVVTFQTLELEDTDDGFGWTYVNFVDNPYVNPGVLHFNKSFLAFGDSR